MSRVRTIMFGFLFPEKEIALDSHDQSGAPQSAQVTFNVAAERMPPLTDEKMSPDQKKAATELVAGPRGEVKGPFVSLIRSPEFMRRVQKVGEYIRFVCPIDKRLNEFAAVHRGPPLESAI